MRITRVEAQNLKGRSFAYDLEPAVAIIGDNFTGKSSVIDAIRLALIGYIPELGKTNAATWQLASDERMDATVKLEDGQYIRTSAWLERGSPKISKTWQIDVPLLNASAYFAMSERERYDYVFQIARMPDEFSITSIIAECERISFEEAHTEAIEDAKRFVIQNLALIKPDTVQQWLSDCVDSLKSQFTRWNGRVKDTVGAVRVLTELKNRQEAMPGNVQQLAGAEKLARSAAEEASLTLVSLDRRRREALALEGRRRRLESLRKASDVSTDILVLEQNIAEARVMLVALEPFDQALLADKKETAARIMGMLPKVGAQKQRTEKAELDLQKQDKCPYCSSTSKNWKSRLSKTLQEEIQRVDREYREGAELLSGLQIEIAKDEKTALAWRQGYERNSELDTKISLWGSQITGLKRKQVEWQKQIAEEEKTIAALGEIVAPTEEELKNADEALAARRNALLKASDRLRTAELLEHDIKRAAQSQLEHEKAKAMVAVIKRVGETLRDKKAALVDLVFTDLLKIANSICSDILKSPLAFHEGEIGRWDGHRWISHKTFSGTEQALTFVAVAAALSQGSPIRLLIFDELGRLDLVNQGKLLGLLFKAQEDRHIDQFIVAGAVPGPKYPPQWKIPLQVIDLNEN